MNKLQEELPPDRCVNATQSTADGLTKPEALEQVRGEVTLLLQDLSEGSDSAINKLMPLIYGELRRIARGCMRRERSNHTLQPTALVHEAYLRLAGQNAGNWQSRGHFFSLAAKMMRRILVDNSRSRLRLKRGMGAEHHLVLKKDLIEPGTPLSTIDLLALDEVLERLGKMDGRMLQIVELRFFAGLGTAEIAEMLGVSEPTVKRNWSAARVWLARALVGAAK